MNSKSVLTYGFAAVAIVYCGNSLNSWINKPQVVESKVEEMAPSLSLVGKEVESNLGITSPQKFIEKQDAVEAKSELAKVIVPLKPVVGVSGDKLSVAKVVSFNKVPQKQIVSDHIVLQLRRGSDLLKILQASPEEASKTLSKIANASIRVVRLSGDIAVLKIEYEDQNSFEASNNDVEQRRRSKFERIATVLKSVPGVVLFEEDVVLHPSMAVNDPRYPEQWYLDSNVFGGSGSSVAWNKTIGKPSTGDIVVAVIDTGITKHSDLDANVLPGYDFIWESSRSGDGSNGWDSDPSDLGDSLSEQEIGAVNSPFIGCEPHPGSSWHGTHVAGILAGVGNNNNGIIGVAPGAKILPVRVLGKCGGYMTDIASGIRWAAGVAMTDVPINPNPAKVINLSLGGIGNCPYYLQSAINDAIGSGAVVVVAAGNEGIDSKNFTPANCTGVVSVGSVGQSGDKAYYSDFGSKISISAPGGDARDSKTILSTLNSGTNFPGAESYAYYQGTSMAAPVVSGGIALVMSANPRLSSASAFSVLSRTARPFPKGSSCAISRNCGVGLIDIGTAVGNAESYMPDIIVTKFTPSAPVVIPNIAFAANIDLTNIGNLGTDVSHKGRVEIYIASAVDGSNPLKIGEANLDNIAGILVKGKKTIKVAGLKIGDQAILKNLLPGKYGIYSKFVSNGWESNPENNLSRRAVFDYVLPQLTIEKKQPINMAPADIGFVASFNDPRISKLVFGSDWVYDWNFSNGQVLNASMGKASIRFTKPGDGVATLTLRHTPSGFAQTATASYSVIEAPPTVVSFTEKYRNEYFRAPVAMSFKPTITTGHPLDRVIGIEWDFDNGAKTFKTYGAYSVFEAGSHVVRMTAKTKMGFSSSFEKTFVVAENQVPICNIDQSLQPDKRSIKFTGSCYDPDGIVKYVSWTVNGNPHPTNALNPYTINLLTNGNGEFNVVIKATDDSKGSGVKQITVGY